MPQTRRERQEDRTEIATELYGIIQGMLGKLIQYDENLQMYVSIAGDDTAEMRRTVALLAADMEARIDARIARAIFNIERCQTKTLQAVIPEEADKWRTKVRIFSRNIEGLKTRRTAVQRILVVEVPWPDIIRVALGAENRRGNIAIMDNATSIAISNAVSTISAGIASGQLPPPPPAPGTASTDPIPPVESATIAPTSPPETVEEDKIKSEESKDEAKK